MKVDMKKFWEECERYDDNLPWEEWKALEYGPTIYYSLVELPGGGHVPLPLLLKEVPVSQLKKMTVSKKIRDGHFFRTSFGWSFYKEIDWEDEEKVERLHRESEAKFLVAKKLVWEVPKRLKLILPDLADETEYWEE